MSEKKQDKLSDLIKWDDDALNLLESLLARLRTTIAEDAIMLAFRNNKQTVNRGTILSVLHATKPITYFVNPEEDQ